MAEEINRRKGDFKFSIGPFAFEGHGVNVLVGALSVGVVLLAGLMYFHLEDSRHTTTAVTNMASGQRLLACLISKDQTLREEQLQQPSSFCRRFARGEF